MFNSFRRFHLNQRGNTAVFYALAAIPMLLAAGAAVDYAGYSATQTRVQAAIDAAALAAAALPNATDSARFAAAEAAFAANAGSGFEGEPRFSIDATDPENKILVAHADVAVPTSLMQVAGITNMNISAHAEVGLLQNKKAEVVLALDYSWSMTETSGSRVKYEAMRNAATRLVQDLSAMGDDKVKFGLVPFSHHVYGTLPGAHVAGGGSAPWTGCTQDRQYPHNLNDSTPTSSRASKWNQPQAPDHKEWGCAGYRDNGLVLRPLTNDTAAVTRQLAAMRPYAYTHIAVGVEFGYHMLSPNAPFTEGADFDDEDTQKILIVLTDGKQTEPGFGPGGRRNVAQGESNLESLCSNVKADGIRVITLAFDLDDSSTRTRLRDCASDAAQDFFIADDDTDLMAAFENIKLAIAGEIFISR